MKKIFISNPLINLILLCLIPIMKIFVDIEKFDTTVFNIFLIIYIILILIFSIISVFQIIYLIKEINNKKLNLFKTFLYTLLLVIFNLLLIPYFYEKIVLNKKIKWTYIIYLLVCIIFLSSYFITDYIYENSLIKLEEMNKNLSEIYNNYSTTDNILSFKFKYGFRESKVNEYDLYVKDSDRKLVVTVFNYDLTNYEEKSIDDFLNKSIKDLSETKEEFKLYKDKEVIELEDKIITRISYEGKTGTSSTCIYTISVITFKNKENFLSYVTEVSIKDKHELYKNELEEIVNSARLN